MHDIKEDSEAKRSRANVQRINFALTSLFLNAFLYLSFPKDASCVIYAWNSGPGDPAHAYEIPLASSHMYYIPEQLSGRPADGRAPPAPTYRCIGGKGLFGRHICAFGAAAPSSHNSPSDKLAPGRRRGGGMERSAGPRPASESDLPALLLPARPHQGGAGERLGSGLPLAANYPAAEQVFGSLVTLAVTPARRRLIGRRGQACGVGVSSSSPSSSSSSSSSSADLSV